MNTKYLLTYHAVERLQERFPVICAKQPELKNWKREAGLNHLRPLFDKMILNSQENKSYINNSLYMIKLYEKYGYNAEYQFLELKEMDILFILTKDRSEKLFRLVTLMPTDFRPTIKNTKYKNTLKKADKYNKFVMSWYDSLDVNVTNVENIAQQKILTIVKTEPKEMLMETILTEELKEFLYEAIQYNKTRVIDKISNSKALHAIIIEEKEYEFIYSKAISGKKEFTLMNVKEISEAEKQKIALQKELNVELITMFKKQVLEHRTIVLEKLSNTRSLHRIDYNGSRYDFLYIKTNKGDREIQLVAIENINRDMILQINNTVQATQFQNIRKLK